MSGASASEYYKKLVGETLNGNYRIEKMIGSGGMGAVFQATHLALGSSVAVKVLAPELASDTSLVKRFQREARVGGNLMHPNIVRVQDFGKTDDGVLFMVMEFVEGETLAGKLLKNTRLSLDETIVIVEALCDALTTAHKNNLLHRDLKPANVLIGKLNGRDVVKLLDFGIVKLLQSDEHQSQLTAVGQVFGTPLYMAPEHLMGLTLTPQADLYSLGVMTYEMLTGALPADQDDLRKLLEAKMKGVPSVTDHVSELPAALDEVFVKALSSNPESRYATANDFLLAIKNARKPDTAKLRAKEMAERPTVEVTALSPPEEKSGGFFGFLKRLFGGK
jgi:eukaryotic-like serine/threonine-protein kinase